MRGTILGASLCCAALSAGCNKWVEKEADKPGKKPPALPAPHGNGGSTGALQKGHVRITVDTLKKEKEAWFKNCLSFVIEGSLVQEVRVGCNKEQSGETFLQTSTPYDFAVTKGGKVNLTFFFDTWPSSSSCITYKDCKDPYPGTPLKRTLNSTLQSIRCYKLAPGKYKLFYEDQPEENLQTDAAIRALLQTSAGKTPDRFNPANPNYDAVYTKRSGASFDQYNAAHACVLRYSNGNNVPENALQACLGIDFRDFVVEIAAVDADIRIGDLTDDRCQAL